MNGALWCMELVRSGISELGQFLECTVYIFYKETERLLQNGAV